jgi:pimeloyl-ACP methyl ester carboxylesterase
MQPVEKSVRIAAEDSLPACNLTYYEFGKPDAPVLICVHGLARNARDFDYIAYALSDRFRVIAIDMPGRGKSPWLDDPMQYSYPNYVKWMVRFMDSLGITSCDWLGTSMGGIIGMIVAASYPTRISRLILNDIGAFIPKEGLLRISNYVGTFPPTDSPEKIKEYIFKTYTLFGITEQKHWEHLFEHSIYQQPDGKFALTYDPEIMATIRKESNNYTEFKDVDLFPVWKQIKCPALILRGMLSDILLPQTVEQMKPTNANLNCVEFNGVGHAPALLADSQITIVSDWLNRTQKHSPGLMQKIKSYLFRKMIK